MEALTIYQNIQTKLSALAMQGLHFQCQALFAINDSYILITSMNFALDRIYMKRPRNSYILPIKNIFVLACSPLDNT